MPSRAASTVIATVGGPPCMPKPSPPYDRNAGSRPKLTTYGNQERTVFLNQRLYVHALSTARRWAMPAAVPLAIDNGMTNRTATAVARVTVWGSIHPIASGLSVRPTRTSRSRSTRSLIQPTVSCPLRIVPATRRHSTPVRPDSSAATVSASVMASVGSGWHVSSRETTSPRGLPDLMRRSIGQEPLRHLVFGTAGCVAANGEPFAGTRIAVLSSPHLASDLHKRRMSRSVDVLDWSPRKGYLAHDIYRRRNGCLPKSRRSGHRGHRDQTDQGGGQAVPRSPHRRTAGPGRSGPGMQPRPGRGPRRCGQGRAGPGLRRAAGGAHRGADELVAPLQGEPREAALR